MAVHRRYDVWAIVVTVLAVIAYASFRTEFRLRSAMPVEFFDRASVPLNRQAAEEAIARAYWRCAVQQIQWQYGYARRLPDEPPAEFSVASVPAGRGANELAVRIHYWQKLRTTWMVTSAWEQHYEWNTISLTDSLRNAGTWLEQRMRVIIGY